MTGPQAMRDKKASKPHDTGEAGNSAAGEIWGQRKKWAFVIALIIAVVDVLAIALGTIIEAVPIALSVSCVGVVTFVGVLTLSNVLSHDLALSKKEMRKAIAASFVLVYLVLLAVSIFGRSTSADTELTKTIIGHFTWVVGIVVIFYFGSRSVEELIKRGQKKGDSEEEPGHEESAR